jgi:DNA-binding transcriptional LysR family regulator
MNTIDGLAIADLLTFDAIYAHKSVSKAALVLDVPQPTVSRRLAALRESFGDPLFVRTRQGMEVTRLGSSLVDPIRQMVEIYNGRLQQAARFDPMTSTRAFRICASDFGHLLVLPKLHAWADKRAPNVCFTAVPLGRSDLINRLESGEVDVAVGGFPNLYAGVKEQTLFRESYACLARRDHPTIGSKMTLQEFKRARHIVVSAHLLGHVHQEVEKRILEVCPPNHVRVVSESFLLSALLVEKTDLVVTLPGRTSEFLGERLGALRMVEPPIELPGFDVKQYWHTRFHDDPGNEWLRRGIACSLGVGGSGEAGPRHEPARRSRDHE